ncbi:MAG: hypothetical protein Q8R30_03625 [bacterium]|nr:hypothetical protein [bacterium]
MVETQQSLSPEQEIQKLEQQLEQKKRQLAESGTQAPEEKELFREVVKEHIETLRPFAPTPAPLLPPVLQPPVASAPQDLQADVKKQEADEATVRMLVEKAMTGTIGDAVKEAQKISPYMVDELHDHLIDDMYGKLLALRKIKAL